MPCPAGPAKQRRKTRAWRVSDDCTVVWRQGTAALFGAVRKNLCKELFKPRDGPSKCQGAGHIIQGTWSAGRAPGTSHDQSSMATPPLGQQIEFVYSRPRSSARPRGVRFHAGGDSVGLCAE